MSVLEVAKLVREGGDVRYGVLVGLADDSFLFATKKDCAIFIRTIDGADYAVFICGNFNRWVDFDADVSGGYGILLAFG